MVNDNLNNSKKTELNLEECLEHLERMLNKKCSNDLLCHYKNLIQWMFGLCSRTLFVHVESDQSIRFTTDNQRFTKKEHKHRKKIPNFVLFERSGNFVIFIPEDKRSEFNLGEYKTENGNQKLVRYIPEIAEKLSLTEMKELIYISYCILEDKGLDYNLSVMQKSEIEGNNRSLNNSAPEKPRLIDEIDHNQIVEERKKNLKVDRCTEGTEKIQKKIIGCLLKKMCDHRL